MGRVRNSGGSSAGIAHRAGPLKQKNKKHNTGKHRSKRMVDNQNRGRVSSAGSVSKRPKQSLNRSARKKQAAVERKKKIQEALDKKKAAGGLRGAPICVALIPLSPVTNVKFMLKYILNNINGVATLVGQSGSATHIKLTNGKNIIFVTPSSNDIWCLLDTLKIADISLFTLSMLEDLTPEGFTFLKAAKDQGMATPFLSVGSSFSKSEEKSFLKSVQRYLPTEKIFPITNPGQISNLLRMISVSKIIIPRQWSLRSCLFIENSCPLNVVDPSTLHENYLATSETSNCGLMEVTGVIRRKNLNPHRPVLISGLGQFKILRVDVTPMQVPKEYVTEAQVEAIQPVPSVPPRFLYDPLAAPVSDEDTDNIVDEEMTSDIDDLDDEDRESQISMDVEEGKSHGRLPKGTSEYQADWLINSDGEADDSIVGSDEELEGDDTDEGSENSEGNNSEDGEMDWEEEKHQLQVVKDAKLESEFPDWVDTPLESPARVRFQKYRGLQSFKNSPWDVNENLPKEYSKIFQFRNFRHVQKVVLGEEDGIGYIPIGQRVTMILKPMDENAVTTVQTLGSSKLTCLVSLLRYETKMSVLNVQLSLSELIKNKEELIFQIGFHRFQAKPILSEVSPGNKHKMLRFGQVNQTCMATIFAPIVFPSASVITFKTSKLELVPVGNGSLFSIDPCRLIIKRVLLSGHPFKVMKKCAVIRFMFFNREDIDWFKPIELRTRYGRRGHIKEPLGTHGHMKCTFDGQMKSQDTVLMPLYKRVFPKMNYSSVVPSFIVFDGY